MKRSIHNQNVFKLTSNDNAPPDVYRRIVRNTSADDETLSRWREELEMLAVWGYAFSHIATRPGEVRGMMMNVCGFGDVMDADAATDADWLDCDDSVCDDERNYEISRNVRKSVDLAVRLLVLKGRLRVPRGEMFPVDEGHDYIQWEPTVSGCVAQLEFPIHGTPDQLPDNFTEVLVPVNKREPGFNCREEWEAPTRRAYLRLYPHVAVDEKGFVIDDDGGAS
ncbi:MAG: hypothetical protein CL484_10070 [Acidobacteria bacterium]|nr:hypothetical protein [Acidobacteriota bacterium]